MDDKIIDTCELYRDDLYDVDDTIVDNWKLYRDALYEYVKNSDFPSINAILNWVGGTIGDVHLATKELLLNGEPIIIDGDMVKLIKTDLERKEEMAKRVKQLRKLQEEINALKELKFEVKE